MNFDDLLKKAIGLLEAKKKLVNIVRVEKKRKRVEDLIEKYDYKTYISPTSNLLITSSFIPTYLPHNFPATTFA